MSSKPENTESSLSEAGKVQIYEKYVTYIDDRFSFLFSKSFLSYCFLNFYFTCSIFQCLFSFTL